MEIEYYIYQYLTDHLDDIDTYQVLSETEARQINVDNFQFICEHFSNDLKANLNKQARDFFINNCKKPYWKKGPVVSGVNSLMQPLSIWLYAMIQSVVHLCLSYLNDSWHLLNDLRKLKKIKKQKIVISDTNAFYTNINTQHTTRHQHSRKMDPPPQRR